MATVCDVPLRGPSVAMAAVVCTTWYGARGIVYLRHGVDVLVFPRSLWCRHWPTRRLYVADAILHAGVGLAVCNAWWYAFVSSPVVSVAAAFLIARSWSLWHSRAQTMWYYANDVYFSKGLPVSTRRDFWRAGYALEALTAALLLRCAM